MQQQQRRLYASVIGVVAVLAIATTLLPWVSLDMLGTKVTWNGLGQTSDLAFSERGIGPHAYGWWVVAAAFVAILSTGLLLSSSAVARTATAPALWLTAAAALAATAVPITALADPPWLIGDFVVDIGAQNLAELIGREFLVVPVLSFTIGALVILALLAIATALMVRPIRMRIRVSIDRGTEKKPTKAAPARTVVIDDEPELDDAPKTAAEPDVESDTEADQPDEDETATRSAGSPPSA